MQKLISILLKTFGLKKLVLMIWNIIYKELKKLVDKSQNSFDNDVLEFVNLIVVTLCAAK